MSAYGAPRPTTPRFDARDPVRLHSAFATSNWTLPTTSSMLTGALPETAGVTLAANDPLDTTAALKVASAVPAFRDLGFRTALFSGNPGLWRVAGLEEGFETFELLYDLPTGNSKEIVDAALSWIDAGDANAPFFLWLQPFDVHFPYLPPAEVSGAFRDPATLPFDVTEQAQRTAIEADFANLDETGQAAIRSGLLDLYDEELLYLDQQVDRLLIALEERGLLSETVVVWTADHGELFDDGGTTFFFHGVSLRPGVNRIPMLVLDPAPDPWRGDGLFSGTDLLPTLFDRLALPPPSFPEGVVFGADPGRTRSYAFDAVGAGWGEAIPAGAAWTDGTHKVLVACETGDAVGYDLRTDPDELAGFDPNQRAETALLLTELAALLPSLHPEGCLP